MFEKILVISEPMPNSGMILHSIVSLKKTGTRQCLLFQCLNPKMLYETASVAVSDIFHANLESQKQYLDEQGFITASMETIGFIKDEINKVARDEGCSLIVTGACEQYMIGNLFMGSAAYSVMHTAVIPLLIVRIPAKPEQITIEQQNPDLFRSVLFPTDFSPNARQAFESLKQMVAAGVVKVTLLHVQDKAKMDPHLLDKLQEFNRIDTERLNQMADELRKTGNVDVSILLLYGSPTGEILKTIREEQVSLVIMGSQGRGFIKDIYLGSVSHNIARHSSANILLIPAVRD